MKNLQDLSITGYLRIVRRRVWYLVIPAVLVSIGSIIYVWRIPYVYKSETTILVSDRLLPEDYIGSLVRQSVMDRIEFAKQQLRSRTFVEKIVQEFQLFPSGTHIDRAIQAVISTTEVTVVPPNVFKLGFYSKDPATAQAVTRRLAERVMQSNDSFRLQKVSVADQFLEEQLRQATDELAQAEQRWQEFNQSHFPGMPEQTISPEILNTLQAQLTAADANLQDALEQRTAYERLLIEHRDLKLAGQSQKSVSGPALKPMPSAATGLVPSVSAALSPPDQKLNQKRAELAALLTRYTPEHPDVDRVTREIHDLESQKPEPAVAKDPELPPAPSTSQPDVGVLPEIDISVDFYEAEVRRELEQLHREIARKEANKRELSNRIAAYGRRMNIPPELVQEYSTLTHDRDAAKQRLTYLTTRKLNSELAGKVDTDANNKTFTTIDPPNLPEIPVRPDRVMLSSFGCLAGLMVGIAFGIGRELLDPTLSDEESAVAELKLPVLTSIPTIGNLNRGEMRLARKRKKEIIAKRIQQGRQSGLQEPKKKLPPEFSIQAADANIRGVILAPLSLAGEQYQMMRAELIAKRQKGVKKLVVTSSVPNEGKTFVACCLAGILAKEQSKRVLLIDGDLRTANAGCAMGVEHGSVPGLSEVLVGKADVENCLLQCAELSLSLLPAGRVPENPAELLSSPRLQEVMLELALLFDWMIVDSPPVLPIADTNLLVPTCDAAIVVVQAEKTSSRVVKECIARIGRERVCGIVMNCARDVKAAHYYDHYDNHTAPARQ